MSTRQKRNGEGRSPGSDVVLPASGTELYPRTLEKDGFLDVSQLSDIEFQIALQDADASALQAFSSRLTGVRRLSARYVPGTEMLLLSGVPSDHPLYLSLRPHSRTYENFLRLIAGELQALGREQARLPISLEKLRAYFERRTKTDAAQSDGTFDVFPDDFEVVESGALEGKLTPRRGAPIRKRFRVPRRCRLRLHPTEDSSLVSALMSLDIESVSVPGEEEVPIPEIAMLRATALHRSFRFLGVPKTELTSGRLTVTQEFHIEPSILRQTELFVHWGRYDGIPWTDHEIPLREVEPLASGNFRFRTVIEISEPGHYGLTCAARALSSDDRIWLGARDSDDVTFDVDQAAPRPTKVPQRYQNFLPNDPRFDETLELLRERDSARILHEASGLNGEALLQFRDRAHEFLKKDGRASKRRSALQNFLMSADRVGIGEIVLISPEGPQAIAGGLAQVITGLLKSLSARNFPVTLITPLYEEGQGNKHRPAEEIIREGIRFDGETIPLKEVGAVSIPFGHTLLSGTPHLKRSPLEVRARVYLAEIGCVRMFFLRHERLADRLYAHVWSDEQVKRAIFLSRGALEVVCSPEFQIDAQILVTNDWLTAFVPVLLATEPKYRDDPSLENVKTVHVIHNCGRDYQGRFLVNHFGEDLFPMIGIAPEHFFGIADPNDRRYLNLTGAAVFHTNDAIVTVSRPYAEQLLTPEGGEGLDGLFRKKKDILFGISNGIDLDAFRRLFWGEGTAFQRKQVRYDPERLLSSLDRLKSTLKQGVQRTYKLIQDPAAVVVSLIGRLAEQKGIRLLIERVGEVSTLEAALIRFPEVQFVIGGPATEGDQSVAELRDLCEELQLRYPGRINAMFDFLPHREALVITQASDLFLMPSRFEPGGITQLEALAAGTPIVARNVGGIKATLRNYNPADESGNSFLFLEFTATALFEAISRGVDLMRDESKRAKIIAEAAYSKNDWADRLPKYVALFHHVLGISDTRYPFLAHERKELESIRPV